MASFDLARLHGGISHVEFPSDGEKPIRVYYRHATAEEIAVAYDRSGLMVGEDGQTRAKSGAADAFGMAPAFAAALVEVAGLCIHAVEGLDGWPERPHRVGLYGLSELTDEARACLPRVALKQIGQTILDASRVGEEVGKEPAPSPSSDF